MSELTPDEVRRLVGTRLTDLESSGLADWFASLDTALAAFPAGELRAVEPPLRSTPGPLRRD